MRTTIQLACACCVLEGQMKEFVTIGYGGRTPDDLLRRLREAGVHVVVDVRLRPDRASMGVYTKARDPAKGIAALLAGPGLEYVSLPELGNLFLGYDDWALRYRELLERAGDLLLARLDEIPGRLALLCAEKRSADCHRREIADFLVRRGSRRLIEHVE